MRLHEITSTHTRKAASRVGRGISAGQGKTAGRGTKGQKSRTGANSNLPRTFEGAATGMIQRLPKLKGFKSHAVKPVAVNMYRIAEHFQVGTTITLENLIEKGIINDTEALQGVKIVGSSKSLPSFTFATDNPKLKLSKKIQ